MENKIYEVTITTKEYRELITEAAENRKEAEIERDRRWRTERENDKLTEEIAFMRKKIAELESELNECINIDEIDVALKKSIVNKEVANNV